MARPTSKCCSLRFEPPLYSLSLLPQTFIEFSVECGWQASIFWWSSKPNVANGIEVVLLGQPTNPAHQSTAEDYQQLWCTAIHLIRHYTWFARHHPLFTEFWRNYVVRRNYEFLTGIFSCVKHRRVCYWPILISEALGRCKLYCFWTTALIVKVSVNCSIATMNWCAKLHITSLLCIPSSERQSVEWMLHLANNEVHKQGLLQQICWE